jgi:predicted protein tyrosine phosphatase
MTSPGTSRKVLFVCTANKLRSPTAEAIFKSRLDLMVKSAGTSRTSPSMLTREHIEWADLIFVMEEEHRKFIRRKFYNLARTKHLHCLEIEDVYEFMDPNLIQVLTDRLNRFIGAPNPHYDQGVK